VIGSHGYHLVGPKAKLQHVLIAETALGKPLPFGAEVHHVNENKLDNRNENLVICQDTEYHSLLHVRKRALIHSGSANNRKCSYCKLWDSIENLSCRKGVKGGKNSGNEYRHKAC